MSNLQKIKQETKEAEAYLESVNQQINDAIAMGNETMADLNDEVSDLNVEKANLLQELIKLRQDIELAKK